MKTIIVLYGLVFAIVVAQLNPIAGAAENLESPYSDMTDCVHFPKGGQFLCFDTFDGRFFGSSSKPVYWIEDGAMRLF